MEADIAVNLQNKPKRRKLQSSQQEDLREPQNVRGPQFKVEKTVQIDQVMGPGSHHGLLANLFSSPD